MVVTADETKRIFEKTGVFLRGHFIYSSWKHGSYYINKDAVYPHTRIVSRLCSDLALHFMERAPQVVIGPATGGIILSQWVAHHATRKLRRQVLSVYAEKTGDGSFVIERDYGKLVTGKRVLVVEDILTTGTSARRVVEAVRMRGGDVVGVGALCNRGGVTVADLGGVPELYALLDVNFETWGKFECPLCQGGMPVNTDAGHGREYLARMACGR